MEDPVSPCPHSVLRRVLDRIPGSAPAGGTFMTSATGSRFAPRIPGTYPASGFADIAPDLDRIPLCTLGQAAADLAGAPFSRRRPVPMRIDSLVAGMCFRLQWQPAGPVWSNDPTGLRGGALLLVKPIFSGPTSPSR